MQSIASAALAAAERDASDRTAELAAIREELSTLSATIDGLAQAQITEQACIAALTAENLLLAAALQARGAMATDDCPIQPVQAEPHE